MERVLAEGVPLVDTSVAQGNQAGREIENPVMSQGVGRGSIVGGYEPGPAKSSWTRD